MNNPKTKKILYILEIIKNILWLIPIGLLALLSISAITPLIEKTAIEKNNTFVKSDFVGVIHVGSVITQKYVDSVISDVNRVSNDKHLKGFLFVFSSPGGDPSASHNFMNYLKQLKNQHPVFGYINTNCTSGCYYSAIGLDSITTNKNSIVGSVGVLMQLLDFSQLSSKIGVTEKTITIGEYKKPFSSFNGMPKDKEQYITDNMLMPVYDNFVDDVINERDIHGNREEIIQKYFDGKVFVGNDPSIKNVLIDEVTDLNSFKQNIIDKLGGTTQNLQFMSIKKKSSFDLIDNIKKSISPSTNSSFNIL